jgi:hypothetical protein
MVFHRRLIKTHILDVAVSLQRCKLSKSFATSFCLTGIGSEEMLRRSLYDDPIQKTRSPDSGMQPDMSITVGLARENLLAYRACIFGLKL